MSLKLRVRFLIIPEELQSKSLTIYLTFYGENLESIEQQCMKAQEYLKARYNWHDEITYEFT